MLGLASFITHAMIEKCIFSSFIYLNVSLFLCASTGSDVVYISESTHIMCLCFATDSQNYVPSDSILESFTKLHKDRQIVIATGTRQTSGPRLAVLQVLTCPYPAVQLEPYSAFAGYVVYACQSLYLVLMSLLFRAIRRSLSRQPLRDTNYDPHRCNHIPRLYLPLMYFRQESSSANKPPPSVPRPSSSVLLLSPANEVLLLHRVHTSSSFASAHVFPGGNLDPYHDGAIPDEGSPERHQDGLAYRIGAIRETFEETGILLARKNNELVNLDVKDRDAARKMIHGNQVKFLEWLESVGAEPDLDGLIPFTRWVTPATNNKRFTTQMYLYMLPQSRSDMPSEMLIPTPDNGIEHTAALFAPAQSFLSRASTNSIILFPPQYFLLKLVTKIITSSSEGTGPQHISEQREQLLSFLKQVPTTETEKGKQHKTSMIPWADKVMSPHNLFIRKQDKRIVLGLDKPGPELRDSERGGDWERVVLVNFGKGGPTNVEVRGREEVLEEERQSKSQEERL
uniref:Nudix hydrolase domain-containing protein n=1 Tax=Gibberella zeae TaxID=5518 RepID=A0A4E9DYZ6_GIBZA